MTAFSHPVDPVTLTQAARILGVARSTLQEWTRTGRLKTSRNARRGAPRGLERRPALARTEPKRGRGRPRADAPPRPGNERSTALKRARYALWKNPEHLKENQQAKLTWIAATDPKLYRAYLLKEALRLIFTMDHDATTEARIVLALISLGGHRPIPGRK